MQTPRIALGFRLPSTTPDTAVVLLLTTGLALCIKLFYSTAGPNELRWMLLPTTVLVEAFSSLTFLFDSQRGYVGVGTPVVIGPGCAGLNFFVIALCMASFSVIERFERHKLYWFLGLVLLTLAVTISVNAFRIVGGIALLDLGNRMGFAVSDTLHTAQGTLFYFAFLVVYFAALRAALDSGDRT